MSDPYDENSTDAMFSRILTRLDSAAEREEARFESVGRKLDSIEAQTKITNGRVTKLETWRDVVHGKITLVAAGVSVAFSIGYMLFQQFLQ